jgi:antitoxin component YwqK of YwqJK toxin-antitoxin module
MQPAPAVTAAPATRTAVSTEAPAAMPVETAVSSNTVEPAPLPEPAVSTKAVEQTLAVAAPIDKTGKALFVFVSLPADGGARKLVYYESAAPIASELINAAGITVSTEGVIKDATYTEFYDSGAIKTVKPMVGGKPSGLVKTYYPTGLPQIEAAYLDGAKNGNFTYFSEDGSPMMEAAYSKDRLNGLKKEYGADGEVKSEVYYVDDKPMDQPLKKAAAAAAPKEEESLVTAKVVTIARGEIISFALNGKYIGKARLDKDCNVITQDGTVPDGSVKIYTKEEKLQKELVFKNNEIKIIRVYEEGGPLKATYTLTEGKAYPLILK